MPRVVLLFVCSLSTVAAAAQGPAERVFRGGTIVTLDGGDRVVEAVAVSDGRILLAGSLPEVQPLIGPRTEIVDLQGKVMLPGFYAAHDHFPSAGAVVLFQVDLNSPPIGSMQTVDDIIAALRERAAQTPPGKWLVGRGYDDTLLKEQRHPTRYDLDRASNEHPIWIIHTSGHLGVANSRALALAGITPDTPQPEGGVIRKDSGTGEPDGVIEERGSLVSRLIPGRGVQDRLEAIRWSNDHYLSKGVTTTVICGGGSASIKDLQAAAERSWLQLRVVAMISSGSGTPATPADAARLNLAPDRIRVGAVKSWYDGSIQGYTGYLSAPYHQQPPGKSDYRGYSLRTRDQLIESVKRYHRAGFQVAIHGNGDAAIDDILDAYAEAQRDFPRQDARHRIEHCQMARQDQLERMRELGVTPSFFVGHVYYWGDRHRDIFLGPERAARISPLRSALDHGLRFTLHNDTPVTPVDPLLLVWAAVNRTTRQGKVLGPDQKIAVRDALRAITLEAAWQNFEEADKGSIEQGKLADFVLLAEDPLTVPPEQIKDIAVLETIVGGQTVYRQSAAD